MTTSMDVHHTTSAPLGRSPDITPFLAVLVADNLHSGSISGPLRQLTDEDLDRMAAIIALSEWCVPYLLEAEGLPGPDTPSLWLARVLPAIAAEKARRRRPTTPKGNGPLAQLKARLDLVEVAERYTTLAPVGHGKLKGLCPLHQEKTPSFYVFPDRQTWRCYGACATYGDVIDLLKARGELPAFQRRNPHKPRHVTFEVRG